MAVKTAERDALRAAVRESGLRATPSRLAVLALLRAATSPISHGEVTAKLTGESWDPATLYRNLTDLVDAKLARRTDLGDHVWRFEAVRESDHSPAEHPHFVCTGCGTVECLPGSELSVRAKAPRAIKRREIEVQVRGLCDACA